MCEELSRVCCLCGKIYSIEFFKHFKKDNVLTRSCSFCRQKSNDWIKNDREKNPKRYSVYSKEWRTRGGEEHKKRHRESIKAARKADPEKHRKYMREYSEKNREKMKEYQKANYWRDADRSRQHAILSAKRNVLFSVYAGKLTPDENVKEREDGVLLVSCFRCGKYFAPKRAEVRSRINAVNGTAQGEAHIYCSESCKMACPVYKSHPYSRKQKTKGRDYVPSGWANEVIGAAGGMCELCGGAEELQAHHIKPVATHPHLAADLVNGLCVCRACHLKLHSLSGCTFPELTVNSVCK